MEGEINIQNMVIRPIAESDLDNFLELSNKASIGLTNLPKDRELLRKKILNSVNSFSIDPTKPGDEMYMFILEDINENKLLGCSAIHSKVGGYEPFYSYQILKQTHESKALNTSKDIMTLNLTAEHSGPTEICTLFLDPGFRKAGLGRLLSLSRFHFIADHPERFEDKVIAEVRGISEEDGSCPFWDHVVRPFFDMDFSRADFLSAKDKGFIADLMPKHPIYVPILPKEAKEVIGKVHKLTEPALRLLLEEGFAMNGHVDIFDAGPRIGVETKEIRSIKDSKKAKIKNIYKENTHISEDNSSKKKYIISNCSIKFRSSLGSIEENSDGTVNISYQTAMGLGLRPDDELRYVTLHK